MAQGGICRRQSVILLLTLHYIFWLEYPAECKCCCKFLHKCREVRRDAAEDGPVPVQLVRFTSILLYTFVSDKLGLNSKYIVSVCDAHRCIACLVLTVSQTEQQNLK